MDINKNFPYGLKVSKHRICGGRILGEFNPKGNRQGPSPPYGIRPFHHCFPRARKCVGTASFRVRTAAITPVLFLNQPFLKNPAGF